MNFDIIENLNTDDVMELYDDTFDYISVYRCLMYVDIGNGDCSTSEACAFGGGYSQSGCEQLCNNFSNCCDSINHNHWDQTDYCYYQQGMVKPFVR